MHKAIKHVGGKTIMGYGNFRGGGSRGGFRGGGRSFGGPRRSFGPREMTKIKCAKCGKEDEVPFKPRDGSSVLCKECYMKEKGITPRSNEGFAKKEKQEDFSEDAEMSEESGEEGQENEEEF